MRCLDVHYGCLQLRPTAVLPATEGRLPTSQDRCSQRSQELLALRFWQLATTTTTKTTTITEGWLQPWTPDGRTTARQDGGVADVNAAVEAEVPG